MKNFFTYLLLLIWTIPTSSQERVSYVKETSRPPETQIDISHLKAVLSFEPEINKVIASCEFDFISTRERVDSISLYVPGFVFSRVFIDDARCEYKISGHYIVIKPAGELAFGTKHKLTLDYAAQPEAGMIYFIGWNDTTNTKRKQIWAHRPHGWLPYQDDLLTVEYIITFDDGFKAVANGERLSQKENSEGTTTWHYKLDKKHPFFSTCIAIGEYDFRQFESNSGLPLEYWYYTEYEENFETAYKYSVVMFDFFEEEIGVHYPYSLYRQIPVEDYMYAAMETTTSTIFGDYLFIPPGSWWQRNYVNVNAHELAHQWFGNYIAHRRSADVWLTEGFATYFAKIFERSIFGEDYYQDQIRQEEDLFYKLSAKNNNPLGASIAGSQRWYQKGSRVLDMLRYVLGDVEFKAVIKEYVERFGGRYAETKDLEQIINDITGRDLGWFFEQWVYRGGEPVFEIGYRQVENINDKHELLINIKQVHETNELTGMFEMPVEIEIYFKDGSIESVNKFINEQSTTISLLISPGKEIAFIVFDPGRKIIKKVKFNRSLDELKAQALNSNQMIDRYDALTVLKDSVFVGKAEFLVKVYENESYYLNKREALRQVRKLDTAVVHSLVRKAISDSDALVRLEALFNMKKIHPDFKDEFELLLQDESYEVIKFALRFLCFSFPDSKDKYLEMTKDLTGWRGMDIRFEWLLHAINSSTEEYINELIDYASPKYGFETRINAVNFLSSGYFLDSTSAYYILEAATHWNNKIAGAARSAIDYLSIPMDKREILNEAFESNKWTKRQEEILSKLLSMP